MTEERKPGDRHDLDTKMEVAVAYLMTGSSEEAGKLIGVPPRTVRYWMQTEWWEHVLSEARTIKQKELDAIWTGLIHKAADKLRTRIDEGDPVLTKTGELKFLPIKAKDLAFLMGTIVDKRALARGQATSRRENVTIEKKLEMLREGFKGIATDDRISEQPDPDELH